MGKKSKTDRKLKKAAKKAAKKMAKGGDVKVDRRSVKPESDKLP
jgi:hypothetical protein